MQTAYLSSCCDWWWVYISSSRLTICRPRSSVTWVTLWWCCPGAGCRVPRPCRQMRWSARRSWCSVSWREPWSLLWSHTRIPRPRSLSSMLTGRSMLSRISGSTRISGIPRPHTRSQLLTRIWLSGMSRPWMSLPQSRCSRCPRCSLSRTRLCLCCVCRWWCSWQRRSSAGSCVTLLQLTRGG